MAPPHPAGWAGRGGAGVLLRERGEALLGGAGDLGEVAAELQVARAPVQGEHAERAVHARVPGLKRAGGLVDRQDLRPGDRVGARVLPALRAAVVGVVTAGID